MCVTGNSSHLSGILKSEYVSIVMLVDFFRISRVVIRRARLITCRHPALHRFDHPLYTVTLLQRSLVFLNIGYFAITYVVAMVSVGLTGELLQKLGWRIFRYQ